MYQRENFVSCYIRLTDPDTLQSLSSRDRGGGVIIRMQYGGVCVTGFICSRHKETALAKCIYFFMIHILWGPGVA